MFTFIVDGKKNKVQNFKQSAHIPIMLISYEMLTKHSEELETIHFDLMICDEGHRLKSDQLKVTVSLDKMDCKRRILLTGTPFQNDMQVLSIYSMIVCKDL